MQSKRTLKAAGWFAAASLAVLVVPACSTGLEVSTSDTVTAVVTTVPPSAVDPEPTAFVSPTRIGEFEGQAVGDVRSEALALGWKVVEVRDVDFEPPPAGVPADYAETTLGLYVDGDFVVEAWSGGYRFP